MTSFSSIGLITDHHDTYVPSFIMAAATEYTAAALLVVLVCDTKKTQNCNSSDPLEGMHNGHTGVMLWETQV